MCGGGRLRHCEYIGQYIIGIFRVDSSSVQCQVVITGDQSPAPSCAASVPVDMAHHLGGV